MEDAIRRYALQNALRYGEAAIGPVMGRIMAEFPEAKNRAREVKEEVARIIAEVNSLSPEDARAELESSAPEMLEKKKGEKRIGLPDLPDAEGGVAMRFAPGPSGPLHIGHTRAAILNDEYVKRYGGRYVLRLEDTNPEKIDPEAYDTIPEDMEWLGISIHETCRQSERFELYYAEARKLLEKGHAYVCNCPPDEWRQLKADQKPCPHREGPIENHLDRWDRMLAGEYGEEEASLVVKTRLDDPNPALRDFASFRIVSHPHPITGSKYCVYPLYNFSVAIDDHYMGMTHVLRGKDHLNNTLRQKYIYKYNGWKLPHFTHYGWVSIEDTLLKTSKIKEGILAGQYTGWDDVRLGTLKAMARRGIRPEAFRKYWIGVGTNPVDMTFTWDTLFACNKEIVDPISPRYFFVKAPMAFMVETPLTLQARVPIHPSKPEEGFRETSIANGDVILLSSYDQQLIDSGGVVRLKDLGNFNLPKGEKRLVYQGNELDVLKKGVKIVHWVKEKDSRHFTVARPEGGNETGQVEAAVVEKKGLVQFERYGFVNILEWKDGEGWGAYSHY
ncbi:MAG: glutamate--tRNA ligase [Candidatus Thermoplasmatota archaeon]|nr:glutamate--tRNA ligase [Candidatus Thermoplasmatota archaeon]